MTLQRVEVDGVEGWRWGDDGTLFVGAQAKRLALREAANTDPTAFAALQSKYEVVMAGEDVDWEAIPEGSKILYTD